MARALPRFDFRVDYAVVTDVGLHRALNEDSALIVPELAVFAVADGMGGLAAGEIASRLAVESAVAFLGSDDARRVLTSFLKLPTLAARHAIFAQLRAAFEASNRAVRAEAERRALGGDGMGTTLDIVLLVRDRAFVAHCGDARVYLARSSAVLQLTQDHGLRESLLASGELPESAHRGMRNPLVNAVGIDPLVEVDTLFVELNKGDRLLLCTDGVHGTMHTESAIGRLLRGGSVEQSAQALVQHALSRGGRDNATALVVEVCERFVTREKGEGASATGPVSSDIGMACHSPLLNGLPMPSVLATLAAAVEVEIAAGHRVPRIVVNDRVCYVVISGQIRLPDGRILGPSGLLFAESLVDVGREGELPIVVENARLMRLRGDDFAEVCSRNLRLSNELHVRIARHLARIRG